MLASQLLLATYLQWVKERGQPNGKPYQPKTLVGYLNAAHLYLQQAICTKIPIKMQEGKIAKWLPIFQDTIALVEKWRERKAKRESI